MAGINVTGLTGSSTFDWQTFVTTIVADDRAAQENALQTEQSTNQTQNSALSTIQSDLTALQTAVTTLNTPTEFNARTATSSDTNWAVTAAAGTPQGTYTFNVTQLATASSLTGPANLGAPLATSPDVSGVSLATLGTAVAPTAGTFTINGVPITVNLSDSLQDLLTQINTATAAAGQPVTASYDPGTDHIKLASPAPILLGAANDTSNFLAAAQLNNNGSGAIESSAGLGVMSPTATLAAARLSHPVTAVDGTGKGSFTINGVTIAYNVNSDSLNAVIARINASAAGVTAAYSPLTGKFSLTNTVTGDLGMTVSESSGGLLGSLGVTGSTPLTHGLNAKYTVNGGPTLTSSSNVLTGASHGLTGLTVTPTTMGTPVTVTVAADTPAMQTNIQAFIASYNAVQNDITNETRITSANGNVTAATLSNDPEVLSLASSLRSAVFAAVPGVSSTLSRLQDIGIDFTSGSNNLSIVDSTALTAALTNQPDQVSAYFQKTGSGFAANLNKILNSYLGVNGLPGEIANEQTALTKSNTDITAQIATIEARLATEQAQMTAQFQAMQNAESSYSQMQTVLTNAFGNNNSSSTTKTG